MNEERITIMGIPEVVHQEGVHTGRNSTKRFTIINGVKIYSRYLRPPLGSCHDFCKYGCKNREEPALEIKAKGSMPLCQGIIETREKDCDLDRTDTLAERGEKFAIRFQSFPVSKTQKVDESLVNGVTSSLNEEEIVLSEQVSLPLKEIELSMQHSNDINMKTESNSMRQQQSYLGVERCSDDGAVKIGESKLLQSQQSSFGVQRSPNDQGEIEVREIKTMQPQQSSLEVQRYSNDEIGVKMRESKPKQSQHSSLEVQGCPNDEREVKKRESKPMQQNQSSFKVHRCLNDDIEVKMRESKPRQQQQFSLDKQGCPNDERKVKKEERKRMRQNQSSSKVQRCSNKEIGVKFRESKSIQRNLSFVVVKRCSNDEGKVKVRNTKHMRQNPSSLGVKRCQNGGEVKVEERKPMRQNQSSLGVQRRSNDEGEVKVKENKPMQQNHSVLRLQRCSNDEGGLKMIENKPMRQNQSSLELQRCSNEESEIKVIESKPMQRNQFPLGLRRFSNEEREVKVTKSRPMQQNQFSLKVQRCSNDETRVKGREGKLRRGNQSSHNKREIKAREGKPVQQNQSSLGKQRCSNDEGSWEMRNLSTNSHRVSGNKRKGKGERSKQMMNFVKDDKKILAPTSFPLFGKHSFKRVSSQVTGNSNNVDGVSELIIQKMVTTPRIKQSSNEHVREKTSHAVETNSNDKTPEYIHGIRVTYLSSPSSSTHEVKSLKHAQIGSFSAKSSTLSAKLKVRGNHNRIHVPNIPSSSALSLRRNGSRVTQFKSHVAGSYTSSLATISTYDGASSEHGEIDAENHISDLKEKHKNRPTKSGSTFLQNGRSTGQKLIFRRGKVVDIHPKDHTPRRLKFKQRVLDNNQVGKSELRKQVVNTAQLSLSSAKQNLRRTGNNIHSALLCPFWPPSPKKKGLVSTQFEVPLAQSRTASLASISVHSDALFKDPETDVENQMLHSGDEYMNRSRNDHPCKRLTSRNKKVFNLNLQDATPSGLIFRQRRLVDSNNDQGDNTFALSLLNAKQNLRCAQNGIQCLQLRQSWIPSPMEKGLRSAQCDAASEHDETEIEKQKLDFHDEDGTTSFKEKCDPSQKPTFRKGNEVELAYKGRSPRTLKFKQNRHRRIFRKEEADDGKVNGTKPESKNVALRHKGTKNKISRGLFNHMIEETASKLVKTRKSKVKALVGAFETVISLQDSKPLVTVLAC